MTKKDQAKSEKFASKFRSPTQRYVAKTAYEEAQRIQLEEDIECTRLYIEWLCIKYNLPKKEILEQYEKDMRQ